MNPKTFSGLPLNICSLATSSTLGVAPPLCTTSRA